VAPLRPPSGSATEAYWYINTEKKRSWNGFDALGLQIYFASGDLSKISENVFVKAHYKEQEKHDTNNV